MRIGTKGLSISQRKLRGGCNALTPSSACGCLTFRILKDLYCIRCVSLTSATLVTLNLMHFTQTLALEFPILKISCLQENDLVQLLGAIIIIGGQITVKGRPAQPLQKIFIPDLHQQQLENHPISLVVDLVTREK